MPERGRAVAANRMDDVTCDSCELAAVLCGGHFGLRREGAGATKYGVAMRALRRQGFCLARANACIDDLSPADLPRHRVREAAPCLGVHATCASEGQEGFRFRSGVELVNVTATVTDRSGRFVPGLTQATSRSTRTIDLSTSPISVPNASR